LEAFQNEFPQFDVRSYDELTELCSRSKVFMRWLIKANSNYSEFAQLPLFLKDKVKPEKYIQLQTCLTSISRKQSQFGLSKTALANKYQTDLAKIENEESESIKTILNTEIDKNDKDLNKILKVISLNSTYLPFSLQMVIQRYVPSNLEDPQESGRVFAREILIRYKEALVDAIINNDSIDVDSLIESNQLK